jgi:hypothetical protein
MIDFASWAVPDAHNPEVAGSNPVPATTTASKHKGSSASALEPLTVLVSGCQRFDTADNRRQPVVKCSSRVPLCPWMRENTELNAQDGAPKQVFKWRWRPREQPFK